MSSNSTDAKNIRIRAYFSHSYRADDKLKNLFFWELFSQKNFYFTVDRKPETPTPMYISYLEWLMRRSACFIAVVPKRYEPDSPYNCSRYQLFENGLAIRARKPRLIFAEDGLPEHLFRGSEEEICFFHPTRYRGQRDEFREKAERLIQKAQAYVTEIAKASKPVALLVDPSQGAYSREVTEAIRRTVRQCKYSFGGIINPYPFSVDFLFALDMEQCEVLICEVRQPYVSLDVFAWVHGRCIPTIRICHLEEGETAEEAALEMHLPYMEELWVEDKHKKWPVLLSGYQLDDEMKPVIFWHTIDELTKEIASRLKKIERSREESIEELFTLSQARKYFLSIGRRDEKVFISNAHSQNKLGMDLHARLREHGVRAFHYKDIDAIRVGSPDWLKSVYREIDESEIFTALLDTKYYGESEWCEKEIEHALPRYQRGEMVIFPYVVEPMEWPQDKLGLIEGKYLTNYNWEERLDIIVGDVSRHLERPVEKHLKRPVEESTEIRIVYYDHLGQLGTFGHIENTRLSDVSLEECQLNVELFDLFRKAGYLSDDWQKVISTIGKELLDEVFQKCELIRNWYSEALRSTGLQERLVHFCFATDRNGFSVPFEWMPTASKSLPICLEHPVRRFLTGCTRPRPALRTLQRGRIRVLLVASNTGRIPHVDDEVDDLEKHFIQRVGLPRENVSKLNTPEATYERVKNEIRSGGYHLLHFAGHGGLDEEKGPYIQVLSESNEKAISAPILKEWIDKSDLRFVYMSNCLSADAIVMGDQEELVKFRFRPIRGIAQAIIEAKVPEVIGFHWPIPDADSRQMALTFYEHFTEGFEAITALYAARRAFANLDARIWATPILIQQF